MSGQNENPLVQAMCQPCCYDHPVIQVEMIETHISWVFLAGDYAYKVKKPVNFGFLDFSSLEKRQHYCQEELRLNRRFAPQLYLTVVAIGGEPRALRLNAAPARDYAVKMRRFDRTAQLDQLLAAGSLSDQQIEQFATMLAKIHQTAAVAGMRDNFGSPTAIQDPMEENFNQIRPLLPETELRQLEEIQQWSQQELKQRQALLWQRKTAGFIRECHGDIHLANSVWFAGQPLLFDCIEFAENLRWIDVISDCAFLLMDLDDREAPQLGWRFLNRYLQETGDYQGLQLLRCYKVYRAMVRAKVLCLRLQQSGLSTQDYLLDLARYHSYLQLAQSDTSLPAGVLIITHGLSGSGKSRFAKQLADRVGAIHLQSDRERKRLYGLAATANSGSPLNAGIYSRAAHSATYTRLRQLTETILTAGYPVIVDATFLNQSQRQGFQLLATELRVPLVILDFSVPEAELRRRIQQRRTTETAVSEADLQVLDFQLSEQQPLTRAERQLTLNIFPDTGPTAIAEQIEQRRARN